MSEFSEEMGKQVFYFLFKYFSLYIDHGFYLSFNYAKLLLLKTTNFKEIFTLIRNSQTDLKLVKVGILNPDIRLLSDDILRQHRIYVISAKYIVSISGFVCLKVDKKTV